MNALADFSHKFGSQPREIKIGQSFFANDADTVFHTIRYDFLPASIDPNKTSAIDFGENGKVTITMPNVEGSGTTESVYQGQRKPHQKECVLIINNETGDIILERLNQSMIVKKARLRQEDLTGKSLALNHKVPTSTSAGISTNFSLTNGTNITQLASANSSNTTNSITQAKNNSSSEKKSFLQKNSAKKQSPSLSNGTSNSAILRPNGLSNKTSTISPPSMPVFNTNTTAKLASVNKINSNSNSDSGNSDWKLKIPDPPDTSKFVSKQPSTAILSELSSSDSSDSEAESSSDHFSDNENKSSKVISSGKVSLQSSGNNSVSSRSSTTLPPSMPSLVAPLRLPDSPEDRKKSTSAAGLTLSEDSDSSSSSDEDDEDKVNNNNVDKSSFKTNNVITGKSSSSESLQKFNNNNNDLPAETTSNYTSMPKFSQLSQDLQLSESDSDD